MEYKTATYKLTPVSKENFDYIEICLREQYGVTGEIISDWKNGTFSINVPHEEVIDFTDPNGILIADVEIVESTAIDGIRKQLNNAGYYQTSEFPKEFFVKKSEDDTFVCISKSEDEFGYDETTSFDISVAGDDWHETVNSFYSPEYNKFDLSDVIWEADQLGS